MNEYISLRNKRNTEKSIKKVISDILAINLDVLEMDTNLIDLEVDDLDIIEIVINLESEFKFSISDEAIEKFTTVGDICTYIQEKINNK